MFELFHEPKIDFMKYKWLWIGISLCTITASLIIVPIKGVRKAVEFTGGAEVVLRYVETPRLEDVRAKLDASGLPSVSVTEFDTQKTGGKEIDIRVGLPEKRAGEERDLAKKVTAVLYPEEVRNKVAQGMLDLNTSDQSTIAGRLVREAGVNPDEAGKIADALVTHRRENGGVFQNIAEAKGVQGLGAAAGWLDQHAFVGPFGLRQQQVIEASVSGEMRSKALWATAGALLGMLLYIWFRFQFQWGLGAIAALIHDTIFTLGLFSLSGFEANLPVIAAFLTLIGYSNNDTVVIFDRIRENLKTRGMANFEAVINDSINQTLSRTIITSFLTWLSVLALFLFGGPVLRPFAFVLLVGILVGTYSSIYIASPILTIWLKIFKKKEAPTKSPAPQGKSAKGARA